MKKTMVEASIRMAFIILASMTIWFFFQNTINYLYQWYPLNHLCGVPFAVVWFVFGEEKQIFKYETRVGITIAIALINFLLILRGFMVMADL